MKHIRKLFVIVLVFSLVFQSGFITAHSGRTDSAGGHHDYKNASGLGSYHYHHGYGPHLHTGGVCPYKANTSTSSSQSKTRKQNRKYQKMLNKLGYSCGTPDGVLGAKSKKSIRKFQRKNKLSVTGSLNKYTKSIIIKKYNAKY